MQVEHKLVKNPKLVRIPAVGRQASWLFTNRSRGVELPRTNALSGRVKNLSLGPPDYESSVLDHSATPSPKTDEFLDHDKFLVHKLNTFTVIVIKYPNASENTTRNGVIKC